MKRVLTALVLIPIFVACVLAKSPYYFFAMVGIGAVLAAVEYESVAAASGAPRGRVLVPALTLLALATAVWPEQLPLPAVLAAAFLGLMLWGLFACPESRQVMPGVSSALFGALYVGFLLTYAVALRRDADGPSLIFALCVTVWAGDSAAYYVGRSVGKHKLFERVSPKKTWEGAAANVVASVLALAIARWTFYKALRPLDVVVLGLAISVVGQLGDLFESVLKRGAGVKDSSNILPGHGGMLDRIDSLLFAGPVIYYYHAVFMA